MAEGRSGGGARPGSTGIEAGWQVYAATTLVLLLVFNFAFGRAPLWVPALYAAGGILSGLTYLWDKHAARRGQWRVREARLHGLDLCFGIAGGLVAQMLFHHKTRKPEFLRFSWLIFALHAGLLLVLLSAGPLDRFSVQ